MQQLKIFNGRVISGSGIIEGGTVLVTDGIITTIAEGNVDTIDALEIDAGGQYISPGFIDLHIHGGGGFDFMDATETAFLEIARTHAKFGTTAMLPTSLTSTTEEMMDTLSAYEASIKKNELGSQFLGMHLEGPYFAMNQRGAQDPKYIRNPDPAEYESILSQSHCIRRWSAAPELPGAIEFGRYVKSKGVLASVAHTDAVYEDVVVAVENGYSLATHLYSGMSGVTRRNAFRYAGVVESALLLDEMDVEIIADGVHLPAPLLKLVYKVKGADRTALVTDAMRAAGTTVTESILGNSRNGLNVIIEDGVAKLTDRSSFAGSIATADRLVRTMVSMAGVSIEQAVRMISATPARIIGVQDRKGKLAPGMDADIVLFNEDIQVSTTIIKGNIVYQRL